MLPLGQAVYRFSDWSNATAPQDLQFGSCGAIGGGL